MFFENNVTDEHSSVFSGGERQAGFLEFLFQARTNRVNLFPTNRGEINVVHVMHATGNDDLQKALFVGNVGKPAADTRGHRNGIIKIQLQPVLELPWLMWM